VVEELDPRRRADLAAVRERVPARRQRGRVRRGDERRLGRRARAVALRCAARGVAIAAGSDFPRSSLSIRIWSTVVMIVEPPGEPSASAGFPSRVTIVGDIELRGRLPPSGAFTCFGSS
jgi:hypothetical protein